MISASVTYLKKAVKKRKKKPTPKNAYESSIFQHFSWNLCIGNKCLRSTNIEDLHNQPVLFSKWVYTGRVCGIESQQQ